MNIFLTKAYGFNESSSHTWPLAFSQEGDRQRALGLLEEGDRVIIGTTKTKEVREDLKGKALGIVVPTKECLNTLDFEGVTKEEHKLNAKNQFKWPLCLSLREAWEIPSRPLLSDLFEGHSEFLRQYGRSLSRQIHKIPEEVKRKVMDLKLNHVPLPQLREPPEFLSEEAFGSSRRSRKSGPPPSYSRSKFEIEEGPAYTYVFEVSGADKKSYKIGMSKDWRRRLNEFNHHSMPNLGGLNYVLVFEKKLDSREKAYKMEQRLLERFGNHQNPSNHEIITDISEDQLRSAWNDLVLELT